MRSTLLASLILAATAACSLPTGSVPVGSNGVDDVRESVTIQTIAGVVEITDVEGTPGFMLEINEDRQVRLLGEVDGLGELVGRRIRAEGAFMASGAFMVRSYEVAD
jgi:hypothetical protein